MTRATTFLLVFLSLSLLYPPTPSLAGRRSARHAKKSAEREARELFRQGDAHYRAGRYQEAAAAFEKAYELSNRPALLYNLANAHERLGNRGRAATYLRKYLEHPNVRSREAVEQRAARLEALHREKLDKEAAARRAAEKREAEVRAAAAARRRAAAQRPAPPPPPPRRSRLPAYLTLGVAGGVAIASLALALASKSAGDDAAAHCSGGVCLSAARDALDREKGLALGADIGFGLALVSAGVGTWLLLRTFGGAHTERVTAARTSARMRLQPLVSAHGGGLGLVGTY